MMNDLTIHWSIEDAEAADFVPTYGDDDESSLIPCLDLFVESGILELVHVPIFAPFVIMPEYVRFDARGPLDPDMLRRDLAAGGALRKLIVELRCAAVIDRGLLTSCQAFCARLAVLIKLSGSAATSDRPKAQPRRANDTDRRGG